MKNTIVFLFVLQFLIFTNCSMTGEEIARLPINQVSSSEDNMVIREASVDLKKDQKIAIWSEMDMKYEGAVALRFRVEILKEGVRYRELEIDPTDKNITLGEVKTELLNKTNWRFRGKNTEVNIEEDANYTFRAMLIASENSTLKIDKAELVIKK